MPRPHNPSLHSPDGLHPRERGHQKRRLALAIIAVFGFSTTTLVARFLGVKATDLLPRLNRNGLVAPIDLPGFASRVWVLTRAGQQAAEMVLARPLRPIRPHRFNTSLFVHQWMVQTEFLDLLENATPAGMKAPGLEAVLQRCRESRDLGHLTVGIRPDLLHESTDGSGRKHGLAIEIERTPKGTPELRRKLVLLPAFAERFENLTIQWAIAGGPRVVQRYERVWADVADFCAHGDAQRATQLLNLCRFKGLSDTALYGYR